MQDPLYNICRHIKACGENAPKLQRILDDNSAIIAKAKGSANNHQPWPGGFLQHISDTLDFASHIFSIERVFPFTWSSVVLVLVLHDIEKPFVQDRMAKDSQMPIWSKEQRANFREDLILVYNIELTAEERTALKYVEGEGQDYSPNKRIMNELSALCHAADILSARLWHSSSKPVKKAT